MNTLPADFIFSQSNLQNFEDCRRRFQLRHLNGMTWPALETEPAQEHEHLMEMGNRLHHLAHQFHLGLSADQLIPFVQDPILARWWQHFLDHYPADLPTQRRAELTLSTSLAGHRLQAKYDLIAAEPGKRMVIVDWKTSRNLPTRERLASRFQSRLYPYILVEAGSHLNGGASVRPDDVEMMYWFAEHPGDPIRFLYSTAEHEQTRQELTGLIETIQGLGADEFPLTAEIKRCAICTFRSYCDRGEEAAPLNVWAESDAETDLADLEIDLELISEIEF